MIENAEAVFFDIGGVLLDLASVREGHRRFVVELAGEYDLDADRAIDTWREVVGTHFRERRGTEFRSATEGYARGVNAAVGERVPESEWRPLFERVTKECMKPIDGARETLERLGGEVPLSVISDIDDREAERILGTFGFADFFDSVVTSETVGRTKPDPAMFATAIGVAGVTPEKSAMIGDRYHNDMRGGSWAALNTIAFGGSAASGPGGSDDLGLDDESTNSDESARDPDGVVDYRITDLREVPELVGLDFP